MHSSLLIVGILTIGFTLANLFAYVMQRLHLPSILGYLLAGYIIGPYSPGFVADAEIAKQLAEIGVILMLFSVGLNFKIEDLVRVKNIAIPGAIVQTFFATFFTILIVYSMGMSITVGLVMGLSIGVASTVVLVRVLTNNKLLNTTQGHIAVGWLIVEDIFTIIILILLPTIKTISMGVNFSVIEIAGIFLLVIAKLFILMLFMFTWGQNIIDYILKKVVPLASQELFTLTIITFIFLIATGSSIVFGTSIALGAFIAGMVIGKTNVRYQAAASSLSLKDIFAVIFFLSIGMLFKPMAIIDYFPFFVGIISVIMLIKPLVAYLIILAFGYSLNTALTVAVSLAQIGEFSFILAAEAMNLSLIPNESFDVLVACAMISISLNPLLFQMLSFFESTIQKFFNKHFRPIDLIEEQNFPPKVLVIGYNSIGKIVSKILKDSGFTPVVIEKNIVNLASVEENIITFHGHADNPNILNKAHIKEISYLIITILDTPKTVKIIKEARNINPDIQIIARIQLIEEKSLLQELNIEYVCTESEVLRGFDFLIRKLFKAKVI
ncbi:Inner membrane protein YbaL [Candidatus Rubidus massiliensis]|nr:MAG: hypothetical protein BGO10_09075 [Chlamydia sp. 32-24]CDZ81193.1 Inner membrane protein YbaL [Candidatus Rubidus massiliensis]